MATTEVGQDAGEQQLRWMLDALGRIHEVSVDELRRHIDDTDWGPRWSLEQEVDELRRGAIATPFTVESITSAGPGEHTAVVVAADGKRWSITCWLGDGDHPTITGLRIIPAPPEGTTVRDAVEADGPELAALERRSPLRLGEDRMIFDRGDDYFASARLMDELTVYVAEGGGALTGVYWGAQQHVRIGGDDRTLFLEHHVRIDPETARGGVFWALCTYGRDRYARTTDSIAFWVSPDNHAVRKFFEGMPAWSVQAERRLLACTPGVDGDVAGRMATPDDAALIAEILNGCHGDSELYVPHTADTVTARLTKDPGQYGWEDVRILDDTALVGVPRSLVRVVREGPAGRDESMRATAIDHGFLPGGEGAYERLLQGWAAMLSGRGATHLTVFTSVGSATKPVVERLAPKVEVFDLFTFTIEEPPGLADRGLYVDPVYF